jgi:polysaccharide biosynthesis transport protein
MSQDITLHAPGRGLPAAPEDLWGQPQNGNALGSYQPQNGQQPQPLKKLQRLLRGRVLLALCLSAVGAIGGAYAGYKSQVPLYSGETQVEIKATVPNITLLDKATPYFTQTLKNESLRIPSDRVITAALQQPEWVNAGGHKYTKDYVAIFENNLTVTLAKDSSMIQIAFQSESPKLAAAGANATMNAYVTIKAEDGSDTQGQKLKLANQALDDAQRQKHDLTEQMLKLTSDYGTTDLSQLLTDRQLKRQNLEFQVRMQELALKDEQAVTPDVKGNRNVTPLTPPEIAQYDSQMRALLDNMQQKTDALAQAKEFFGPKNPAVTRAQSELELAVKAVNDYAANASKRYLGQMAGPQNGGGTLIPITPGSIEAQSRALANDKAELAVETDSISKLGAINQSVQELMEQSKRIDEKIKKLSDDIDALAVSGALGGQIIPQGEAIVPNTPAVDKRPQVALVGFVLGGGIPFGLMLLIGLLDSRYRYSDDTSDAGVHGLTLLGILPNLPDRLSDPGQASIAAHCVHQIRTMLQINNLQDRKAFSVTSASSGDGKTSLTLALGLSFAASGSRTLLIDSDLVGAGLTARLGMNGPEGILEAMTSGNLMEYVKQTDVSDLSILPVGLAQLHHAGIFSPQSVRRLVNEAKKHFEIILIDTGPILGSIEATPVAAASDGVILTVARGQQRPLVEKALAHLNSIGARVAGVVFNRAQSRDFEQSISGISMRSASRNSANGNGASRAGQQRDAGQYGPVARAVASATTAKTNGETAKN